MSRPAAVLQLEWVETYRSTPQERRYRNRAACARQLASILAAPDDVARLRGLWVTSGYRDSRLDWTELDPHEFLASVAEAVVDSDVLTDEVGLVDRYEHIAGAWTEYDERSRA